MEWNSNCYNILIVNYLILQLIFLFLLVVNVLALFSFSAF